MMGVAANVGRGPVGEQAAVGASIGDVIEVFQHEARQLLKTTNGDMAQVIRHALAELEQSGMITPADRKRLVGSVNDALDVLAGKAKASKVLAASQKRNASLLADHASTGVARSLGELYHAVVKDAALREAIGTNGSQTAVARAVSTTTVSGKGEQALLWGSIGALIGGSIGGVGGALIGGAVGAAVGSCGDSDTTVTVTNNGGGSPA